MTRTMQFTTVWQINCADINISCTWGKKNLPHANRKDTNMKIA